MERFKVYGQKLYIGNSSGTIHVFNPSMIAEPEWKRLFFDG